MKKYLVGFLLCALAGTATNAMARELNAKEKGVIESVVKPQLKDPDSAKFYWQDYKGGDIYCAHVNAKNSYGGYSGKALLIVGVKVDEKGVINKAQATINNDNIMDSICTDLGYSA